MIIDIKEALTSYIEEKLKPELKKEIKEELKEEIPLELNLSKTYLSIPEVADLLRISIPTVHKYSKSGRLTKYKFGSRTLYKNDEVLSELKKIESLRS